MWISIRQAVMADAPRIASVIHACFPDDTVDAARVATALTLVDHVTFVAVTDDQPVGFLAGFVTPSSHGVRWNLDLLGVHPDHRGLGLSSQLVATSTDAGKQQGAVLARGLVRVGNVGAEGAFSRAGYGVSSETFGLFVASDETPIIHAPSPVLNLIPVQTLTYSGLWLEDELNYDNLLHANAARVRRSLDVVGAVIPTANSAAVQAAHDSRYILINTYRWWTLRFDRTGMPS